LRCTSSNSLLDGELVIAAAGTLEKEFGCLVSYTLADSRLLKEGGGALTYQHTGAGTFGVN